MPQTSLQINDLARSRLIGQLFDTYLLLELDQELLLVDQHAAHEKILFEALLKRQAEAAAKQQAIPVRDLLVPMVIEVSRREMQILQQEPAAFRQLGFEYDCFGPASVVLRSLPDAGKHEMMPEPAFRMALDTILAEETDPLGRIADFYYSMACKAAVKAHDHLQPQEIDQLLGDLRLLDNPYQCPHGRPVIIRLSRYELEKRFKRIV